MSSLVEDNNLEDTITIKQEEFTAYSDPIREAQISPDLIIKEEPIVTISLDSSDDESVILISDESNHSRKADETVSMKIKTESDLPFEGFVLKGKKIKTERDVVKQEKPDTDVKKIQVKCEKSPSIDEKPSTSSSLTGTCSSTSKALSSSAGDVKKMQVKSEKSPIIDEKHVKKMQVKCEKPPSIDEKPSTSSSSAATAHSSSARSSFSSYFTGACSSTSKARSSSAGVSKTTTKTSSTSTSGSEKSKVEHFPTQYRKPKILLPSLKDCKDINAEINKIVRMSKERSQRNDVQRSRKNKVKKKRRKKAKDQEKRVFDCAHCLYKTNRRVDIKLHLAVRHNRLLFKRDKSDFYPRTVHIEYFCRKCTFTSMVLEKLQQHLLRHYSEQVKVKPQEKATTVSVIKYGEGERKPQDVKIEKSYISETSNDIKTPQEKVTPKSVNSLLTSNDIKPDVKNESPLDNSQPIKTEINKKLFEKRRGMSLSQVPKRVCAEKARIATIALQDSDSEPNVDAIKKCVTRANSVDSDWSRNSSRRGSTTSVDSNTSIKNAAPVESDTSKKKIADYFRKTPTEAQPLSRFDVKESKVVLNCYNCSYCIFKTSAREILNKHVEEHLMCAQCGFRAPSQILLKTHEMEEHSIFSCSKCSFQSERAVLVNKHFAKAHGPGHLFFPCRWCRTTFTSKFALALHVKSAHRSKTQSKTAKVLVLHPKKLFPCDFCSEIFKSTYFLEKHLTAQHSQISASCPMCEYHTQSCDSLRLHFSRHITYACSVCKYENASKINLHHHIKTSHPFKNTKYNNSLKVALSSDLSSENQKITLEVNYKSNKSTKCCQFCDFNGTSRELHAHIKKFHKSKFLAQDRSLNKRLVDTHNINTHSDDEIKIKIFTCKFCSFSARSEKILNRHYKKIHKFNVDSLNKLKKDAAVFQTLKKNFKCDNCNFFSASQQLLTQHVREAHTPVQLKPTNVKAYACDHCSYITMNADDFKNHLTCKHSIKGPFRFEELCCEYCEAKLDDDESLKSHVFSKHKCKFCSFVARDLKNHIMLKHASKQIYKCNFCDFQSSKYNVLVSHSYTIHRICLDKSDLSKKKPLVQMLRRFNCPFCMFNCKSSFKLKRHIIYRHTPKVMLDSKNDSDYADKSDESNDPHDSAEVSKFSCNICSFKASSEVKLRIHYSEEHREKIYNCEKCKFKCNTRNYFFVHMKSHEETQKSTRKFSCKECSYIGTSLRSLLAHNKRHTDKSEVTDKLTQISYEFVNGKFKCDLCDYAATSRGSVNKHRTHKHKGSETGQSYDCIHCDYKTTNFVSLKKHISMKHGGYEKYQSVYEGTERRKQHNESFLYSCKDCDFKTSKLTVFDRHVMRNHVQVENGIFSCPHCDKKVNSAETLQKHLSIIHAINKSLLYVAKNYSKK